MQLKSLTLNRPYSDNDIWGRRLLYLLSKDQKVITNIDPNLPAFNGFRRCNHLISFRLNDQNFIIDDWDYNYPTSELLNQENLSKYGINSTNIPTILKIQYADSDKSLYDQIYIKHKIKVLPFIIFPNKNFTLEFMHWKNIYHTYVCLYSGRRWRSRNSWIRSIKNMNDILCLDTTISDSDYQNKLKQIKWGLILRGKGVGKNRREVEYMSLGMPIALNYIPVYPFKYEPNKHYVYLEKPEDILRLSDIDPEPYAQKSLEIYNKYYSLNLGGLYNSFNTALYEHYTNNE